MNRRKFIFTTLVLATATWISGYGEDTFAASTTSSPNISPHEDSTGYYTCTMHPQVHMHEPGKCPICGMPLVKVKGKTGDPKAIPPQSQAGVEIAEAQLKTAKISKYIVTKKDLEISIPASGRALSSREIAFQIYESDLSIVKLGSDFTGSPSSQPETVLKGRITGIDRLVDPSSRTVRVTGFLEGAFSLMTEGGFNGEIRTTLRNQIVVPIESILHMGTRDLVYAFTVNGKLLPVPVQLGAKSKSEYQILSGLKEGEVVSTGPNFLVDSEAKLRGIFESTDSGGNATTPQCPPDQHWDNPMAMCMPGKSSK